MFHRFTKGAIKVIFLAQEESRRLGHNFVGTEQILLGLIGEGNGIAAKSLESIGLNLNDMRVEVEKIDGRSFGVIEVAIPFTPKAKKALTCACDEADRLESASIGTEHLLLGLIRDVNESLEEEHRGVAGRVLEKLEVDLHALRLKVLDMIESKTK